MSMPKITLLVGVLLVIEGLGFYSASVLILALLTGGFLVLCVNSFTDARRRRRQGL